MFLWQADQKAPPWGDSKGLSSSFDYTPFTGQFPERTVKEWEDSVIPDKWKETLLIFLESGGLPNGTDYSSIDLIRGLSYIDPALGLLAAHHDPSHVDVRDR